MLFGLGYDSCMLYPLTTWKSAIQASYFDSCMRFSSIRYIATYIHCDCVRQESLSYFALQSTFAGSLHFALVDLHAVCKHTLKMKRLKDNYNRL